mgnify:CR=1 FL=1
MNEEMKLAIFEKMLKLEHLAETETFDGHNYTEQSNGAFEILASLGLDSEYVSWSFGK